MHAQNAAQPVKATRPYLVQARRCRQSRVWRRRISRFCRHSPVLLAIDVARMGYPRDDHQLFPVVHRVDDAVIANAEAEVIATGKLY